MGSMMIIMESSALPFLLLASMFNTFILLVGGSGTLRDVKIALPPFVKRGDDVKLSCNYNLERDQLYAVNWYKGTQEFYRYVPKEAPPQKAFHRPGVLVDITRSTDHDVFLRNVSLDISGVYKCSATAESTFQTLSSSSDMMVVVIGDDVPSLQLDRAQYHPGDSVTAECQSPYSYPPANITWFYNDTEVEPDQHSFKTELKKSITDPMIQSRLSRFSFDLTIPEEAPVSSVIPIKCRATLYALYDQNSSTKTIEPIPRRTTGTGPLFRPGTSSSSPSWLVAGPDSALRFPLVLLLVSGVTTAFSFVENLNWLLCRVSRSLLYPFYYCHHHHHHLHQHQHQHYTRSWCGWIW
ncbi:unnamed protein product [Orchesella dallaii]|uniref:Ig-like domain-containing protein n=1 Tax=Orchesella dallaii TaxID=48710 RepID=A0ABP1RXI2_9HEXA